MERKPPPSDDALRENERLRKELERSQEENRKLREENKKLKEQLARFQHTAAAKEVSAPSSKQFVRPRVQSPRPDTGRHPGAQPGHPPQVRRVPDHIDKTEEIRLETSPCCHKPLGEPSSQYPRFTTEYIPARMEVTRFIIHRYRCPGCGRLVQGSSPHILPRRQVGPRLAAIIALLSMMGLPVRRIQETLQTMADLTISVGEIQDLLTFVAERLGPAYEEIREEVRHAAVVHGDETGIRVMGDNWWAWVFATELAVYYELAPNRKQENAERILGTDFAGTLCCDGWCGYETVGGRKAACWLVYQPFCEAP